MPGIVCPSYKTGFASPQRGGVKYPGLWRGRVFSVSPFLGETGLSLKDDGSLRSPGVSTGLLNSDIGVVRHGYKSVQFNSSDEQYFIHTLPTGSVLDFGLNPFSIECWCVVSAVTTFPYQVLKSNYITGGGTTVNWGLGINNNSIRILSCASNLSIAHTYVSDLLHICGTYSGGVSGTLRLYKNGIEIGSGAGPAAATAEVTALSIGGLRPASSDLWTGNFYGAGVYNRQMTSPEIRLLSTRPGIVYERASRRSRKAAAGAASSLPNFIHHYRQQGIM